MFRVNTKIVLMLIGLTLVGASTASGQTFWLNFWQLIHCSGTNVNHSDDGPPDSEEYSDVGFEWDQCHGHSGEQGTCNGSEGDGTWQVNCWESLRGQQRCNATFLCPDNSQLYCSGTDIHAYAGVATEDGSRRGFVLCEDSGGNKVGGGQCFY